MKVLINYLQFLKGRDMGFFSGIKAWFSGGKSNDSLEKRHTLEEEVSIESEDYGTGFYKFKVTDRENSCIELINEEKMELEDIISSIETNEDNILNADLLKSIDLAIKKYEENIDIYTQNLIDSAEQMNEEKQEIPPEVINIFIYHYLNMLKNPLANRDWTVFYRFFLDSNKDDKETNSNTVDNYIGDKSPSKELQDFISWTGNMVAAIERNEVDIENLFYDFLNTRGIYCLIKMNRYEDKKDILLSDKIYNISSDDLSAASFDFSIAENIYIDFTLFNPERFYTEDTIKMIAEESDVSYELTKKYLDFNTSAFLEMFSGRNTAFLLEEQGRFDVLNNNKDTVKNCHKYVFGMSKNYQDIQVAV